MIKEIQDCFGSERILFSKHARDEMENEESGEIKERELFEAIQSGKVIETYAEDEPYPSSLIYGRTFEDRPLHIVCAYAKEEKTAIIIAVYQPAPDRWIDFERRKMG
jgi:hypothetical protein